MFVDSFARGNGQFKLGRAARLLLANNGAIDRITAGGNVVDFERQDVAATKLTVDGEIAPVRTLLANLSRPFREQLLFLQTGSNC
jgi:hypothetical protein